MSDDTKLTIVLGCLIFALAISAWIVALFILKVDELAISLMHRIRTRRVVKDLDRLLPLCRMPDDAEEMARTSKKGLLIFTTPAWGGKYPQPEEVKMSDPDMTGEVKLAKGEPVYDLVRALTELHGIASGHYETSYRGKPRSATLAAAQKSAALANARARIDQLRKALGADLIKKATGL